MRDPSELLSAPPDAATLQQSLDRVRSKPSSAEWDANVARGLAYSVAQALNEALQAGSADDTLD